MLAEVQQYLLNLQQNICTNLELVDGKRFLIDKWQKDDNSGFGSTNVLEKGNIFEKAGVNFSKITSNNMPSSATDNRPDLIGRSFVATGVSLVIHPINPFVPTAHMNIRFFCAYDDNKKPIWWFGGGFDLTPYYGFIEDAIHWHTTAKSACDKFGNDLYHKYKKQCDEYFYLAHRKEARGIGGLFFDDLNNGNFNNCFNFTKSIGDSFINAYLPIVKLRKDKAYTQDNIDWQRYRRGRYVEFNLVYDRGTLFGLQTDGRVESILMSLPPNVSWEYDKKILANSDEAKLYSDFLPAKNWLNN